MPLITSSDSISKPLVKLLLNPLWFS